MGFSLGKVFQKVEQIARPAIKQAMVEGAGSVGNMFAPGLGTMITKPMAQAMLAPPSVGASIAIAQHQPAGGGLAATFNHNTWGPLAGNVLGGIAAAFTPTPNSGMDGTHPTAGQAPPGSGMTQSGLPVAGGLVLFWRFLSEKIFRFLGKRISKKTLLDFIRKWGPQAAASAVGITAAEALQFWVMSGGDVKRRRGRGISAAQLRTTRRVISGISRMACQLQELGKVKVSGGRKRC